MQTLYVQLQTNQEEEDDNMLLFQSQKKKKKKNSDIRKRRGWVECLFVKHSWPCPKDNGIGCETTPPLAGSRHYINHTRLKSWNAFQWSFPIRGGLTTQLAPTCHPSPFSEHRPTSPPMCVTPRGWKPSTHPSTHYFKYQERNRDCAEYTPITARSSIPVVFVT